MDARDTNLLRTSGVCAEYQSSARVSSSEWRLMWLCSTAAHRPPKSCVPDTLFFIWFMIRIFQIFITAINTDAFRSIQGMPIADASAKGADID